MRLLKKVIMIVLLLCFSAIFGIDDCKAMDTMFGNTIKEMKKWNTKKTYQVKRKNAKYNAILSVDKSEAWIYKIDTTKKTKKLVFPNKIKGAKVTKVGYDFTILKDKYNIIDEETSKGHDKYMLDPDCEYNYVTVFDVLTEGYHDIYGYKARIKNIKKMVLPSDLNWVVPGAFSGMRKLEEVVIPDGVSIVPHEAFADCINLKSVQLPASLLKNEISEMRGAFIGCSNLENITISDESRYYKTVNNMLLSKDCKKLFYVVSGERELVLPEEVTTIKYGAFYRSKIEKLYIGKNLRKMEEGALDSDSITEIVIDENNNYYKVCDEFVLDKRNQSVAVYIMNGEESVRIPDEVKMLTYNNSICGKKKYKKVIIPKSVEQVVGCWAFPFSGKILVYFESENPPEQIDKYKGKTYKLLPKPSNTYVPENSIETYEKWYNKIQSSLETKNEIKGYVTL